MKEPATTHPPRVAKVPACHVLEDALDGLNLAELSPRLADGTVDVQRARQMLTRLVRRGWTVILPDAEVWRLRTSQSWLERLRSYARRSGTRAPIHQIDPVTLDDDSFTFDGPRARGRTFALQLTKTGKEVLFAHWRARPAHSARPRVWAADSRS